MTRPASIRRFGWLWLASTLFWGIATAMTWSRTARALARDPQAAAVASVAQPVWVAIVLIVTALLWYGVAIRASRVAKWLIVAVAVLSALHGLGAVLTAFGPNAPQPLLLGVTTLSAVATVAAAMALFRDDARAWFGDFDADDDAAYGEEAA